MNMAVKQYTNYLILEAAQPLTTLLDSVWKAWLRAMVGGLAGQMAWGPWVDGESTGETGETATNKAR